MVAAAALLLLLLGFGVLHWLEFRSVAPKRGDAGAGGLEVKDPSTLPAKEGGSAPPSSVD